LDTGKVVAFVILDPLLDNRIERRMIIDALSVLIFINGRDKRDAHGFSFLNPGFPRSGKQAFSP
jgi:hypothetical protein